MSSRWPTRNYLRIVLVALAGGFALAVPARAMSVIPPTFPELVQLADQIVRVEITEVGSRFDSAAGNSPIHTYVKCRVLKTLKGGAQETITLRLLGGRVGDVRLEIPDMPAFMAGDKYILFIAENGTAFCPLVGVMHGSYPVVKDDTAAGTERVLRNNRQPLTELAGVVRPMAAEQAGSREALSAPSAALSVADFEDAITQELAHGKKP